MMAIVIERLVVFSLLVACGAPAQPAAEEPVSEPAPVEEEAIGDVRARVADEANLESVDPAITFAMERAVRDVLTDRQQAEVMRVEAVLHRLTDDGAQRHAEVRVTILGVGDERICTVLAGGATAAVSAGSPVQIVEAAMRSALRTFATQMDECARSAVP